MATLTIKNVTKRFGSTTALADVTLVLEPGRICGLLGRNGAGKTTLLNLITGKLFATSGEILVDGEPVAENEKALSKLYYSSESTLYPEGMRVREVIRWAQEFSESFSVAEAMRLAEVFKLDLRKKVKALSTGYTSILKAVLGLSSGREIILLDEPVLGLDANHRELLYRELIACYDRTGASIVLSTHLIEEVAGVLEEAVIIREGHVLLHSSVESLLTGACTVSGEAEAVDDYAAGRRVAASQTMGRFKATTLLEPMSKQDLEAAGNAGLRFEPAELQKLFISMTN